MTPEAMTYLTYILDNIQRFSVKRDQMDWSAWRQEVLKPQVTLTIASADRQQSRQVPLQAEQHSMHRAPQGRRLAHNIGYIQIPELLYPHGEDTPYIEAVHQLLREIDQVETCGWIVDLRHNPGGNLWGMLASLGPLFGEDEWLIFVGPEAKITARYQNGQAIAKTKGVISQIANRYQGVISQAANPYQLKHPNPPIALLIGPFTGSAAEILLLRFYGRPHTRSFGEPTAGVPTAVDTELLSDGAQLCLTKALSVDFVGQTRESSILPEQEIAIDWTQIGTDDDPVLQAALLWLQTKESCQESGLGG